KDKVNIISINKQIIGDKNFNSPGNFSYCGNIVPLNHEIAEESSFSKELLESIRKLFLELNLKGSNGIDFVINGKQFFFMEINPRFQGSIECVEYATGINIVKNHIAAFQGIDLGISENPKYKRKAIKAILFANSEENISVKKYPKSKWIVDRTQYGVLLENGDPFCSIVKPIKAYERDYQNTVKLAKKIIELNQIK
ncbi:MAG: ATP-grasp domain-containing protein, partial [Candidatus Thorarchaeota archaeon]